MKALLVVIICVLTTGWALPSSAQTLSERDWQKLKSWARSYGVTAFPSAPTTGQLVVITDDSVSNACDSDAGEAISLCAWDGVSWISVGGGSGITTLDEAFDGGKTIDGANSVANAVRIGDGTTPMCIYTDATLGPRVKPCTDSNIRTYIPTNYNYGWYDIEGDANMFIVDPDATTKKAMYAFQTGYYPLKSFFLPASSFIVDGAQCAAPTEATPVASGATMYTILCTDNDSSRMQATFDMPDDYDGGTITLKSLVVQTAAPDGTDVIEFQARAQCKGDTETLVAISSFGTEVVWTDTMTGSGAVNKATSGAITPAGTCAAGDLISLSIDIGATNTTTDMATAHILGFKVTYSSTSLSH